MILSLVVAADMQGGIGKDNLLPWHFPEDLKRFKELTMGHTIIVGRKTHESIGRPLPGRTTIVLSRNPVKAEGVFSATSWEEALKLAEKFCKTSLEEVFVIGGSHVYEQALSFADRIYLTKIPGVFKCDAFFPPITPDFVEIKNEKSPCLEYITLENRKKRKDTAHDRYLRDAEFSALVNMMTAMIMQGHYSASELREAAVLARTRYEMQHPQRVFYNPRQTFEAMTEGKIRP